MIPEAGQEHQTDCGNKTDCIVEQQEVRRVQMCEESVSINSAG